MNSRRLFHIVITDYIQPQNCQQWYSLIQEQESLHLQHYSGKRQSIMMNTQYIQNISGMKE